MYKPMTSEEKKLLQAKHRLEEAQARDRVKERKARTRRLIQEGAVLEKVLPEVQAVGLDNLEEYLRRKLQDTIENGWEVSGKPHHKIQQWQILPYTHLYY